MRWQKGSTIMGIIVFKSLEEMRSGPLLTLGFSLAQISNINVWWTWENWKESDSGVPKKFNYKNEEGQQIFKKLTSETTEFTDLFQVKKMILKQSLINLLKAWKTFLIEVSER